MLSYFEFKKYFLTQLNPDLIKLTREPKTHPYCMPKESNRQGINTPKETQNQFIAPYTIRTH